MKNYFLIGFWLLVQTQLQAQPHYFRHYEVEEGLSNNAVICSIQDEKGFLWFGTKDGLNRFDGYTFKTFRYDAGMPGSIGSNFIHCLHEDRSGTLWVGTEEGLYQYHDKTETFYPLKNAPRSEIRSVVTGPKGYLWFIGGLVLYRADPQTGQLRMFSPTEYFQATSLVTTPGGALWVATATGSVEKYNPATGTFTSFNVFKHSPPAASQWIQQLYAASDSVLFIGTSSQGVKKLDLKDSAYRDILVHNEEGTALFVRDFIRIAQDELWIGTESGIYIYNTRTGAFTNLQKQYNNPYSLSDNAIYTFCKDEEGGIWVGTYFGGLNYYPPQYVVFKKYFPKTGENAISGNAVREICPGPYGNLWIGTEDGGLNKYNPQTGKFTVFKPDGTATGITNSNIHGLLLTGDTLWIGTFEHGLDWMDIKTGKVFRHFSAEGSALESNFIYSIKQLQSGEVMLLTANGLYTYDGRLQPFKPVDAFPALFYTTLYEEDNGALWVGTYRNGLYYFNPKTNQKLHFKSEPGVDNSLSNNRVNCIFKDSRGDLWIATEGGLCRYNRDKRTFKRYTVRDNFPSNVIYSILEDEASNLWISTSKGLVCLSLLTGKISSYSKTNGLLNDQFNYNSAYKAPDGRMYFGSVKGMISFDPASFKMNYFHPPVYITGFQVFNKELKIGEKGSPLHQSVLLTDTLILPHHQSTFSIDFAALSYSSPEMTEYAYKMEGLDDNWTYLQTNRKVFFTRLPAGDYVFRVKAANSSGLWNDKETRLYIRVLPPFWKSPPAYVLYALVLLGAGYLISRAYHNRMKEKARRRAEHFEHEKEKEVYQAKIEFFTHVAHEIRTPLTLIKGPMEKVIRKAEQVPQIKNYLKIMERNTDRLLALTGQLLDFRKTETKGYSLNFVRADIALLLRETIQRFSPAAEERGVTIELALPASRFYAYLDIEAIHKVFSNLIGNAVKYADRKILVTLVVSGEKDNHFSIVIKNDGALVPMELKEKIFEVFYRGKKGEKTIGTGIGLSLARSLAELHKGTLELCPPEGAMNVFKLTLPVHHEIEFNPVMS